MHGCTFKSGSDHFFTPKQKEWPKKAEKIIVISNLFMHLCNLGKLVFGKKRSDKSLSKIPIEIRAQRVPNTYSKKNKESNNNFS